MNDLMLKINEEDQTISARELHERLKIKTAFKDWFPRMCEYGFEEGRDFCSFLSESTGGRPSIDANMTIQMAKEICMIQRTPEGKAVRQYLLQIEEAWNSPEQVMARALKIANKTIDSFKLQIKDMQPKADYFDALVDRNLLTTFRDTAKELAVKEKDFVSFLVSKGFIFRDSKRKIKPYAIYATSGKGYFDVKDVKNSKTGYVGQQTFVTPKGKEAFRLMLSVIDEEEV